MSATRTQVDDPIEATLRCDPTIKGKEGVLDFCNEKGWPTTLHFIRRATNDRSLASYLISGACVYSELDIYRWLKTMRRSAVAR